MNYYEQRKEENVDIHWIKMGGNETLIVTLLLSQLHIGYLCHRFIGKSGIGLHFTSLQNWTEFGRG